MISLEEFKKINAEDISDLSEKEIEEMYHFSNVFCEYGMKKWLDGRLNDEDRKMLKCKNNERKDLRNRICQS